MNPEFYTYRITWSEDDKEHVGLCVEFPSLSYLDKNLSNAFEGIRNLVKDVVEDMQNNGEEIPEALSKKKFSGKFMMRILPEEHRMLAIKAAEQGVSLNSYNRSKLLS
ncbi:MAG: toxin-antitoxin system HicB family antitoxin [Proteobacteria bacterium]|nr:toxin-antitoxin system HicB family antitoxin [Pseudomonadota bacterium]